MNTFRGLLLVLLCLPSLGFAQGVRMSADFFPLDVGKTWTYDVTNEAGEKIGQITFAVEDYTIISGTSFYVLSEFPFQIDGGEPIRFVRYDRAERYFLKRVRNEDGALFSDLGASTEVVETDASGAPQKFALKTDKVVLTFQRGVGIVEARFERSGVVRIAKLTDTKAKPPSVPVVGPAPGLTPAPGITPGRGPSIALPPAVPLPPPRPESPVGTVTATNPRIDVGVVPSTGGFRFVMVVTNQSDSLLPFRFNSGKTYDFVVHDAAGKEVWRWSNGNFFTQMLRSDSLRPKGKWQFEENWDRRDTEGKPVPPGSYSLTAIITATPSLQASPVMFDVK